MVRLKNVKEKITNLFYNTNNSGDNIHKQKE